MLSTKKIDELDYVTETGGYTERELSLRPGIRQLASAVVEQWVRDERPVTDLPNIEVWIKIMTF